MKEFLGEDFLLESDTGRELYHEYAKGMPIFDYHCHLPPQQIAENTQFQNLTQIWLRGDHYKWRAMRTNGVAERFCTGDAPDYDKFLAFAETVPSTIGNPLYHWTHLELKRYFGISGTLLDPSTAAVIWEPLQRAARDRCIPCPAAHRAHEREARLHDRRPGRHASSTTTPSPESRASRSRSCPRSGPTRPWRSRPAARTWTTSSASARPPAIQVRSFGDLLEALSRRHEFFHSKGCRLTDHGIDLPVFEPAGERGAGPDLPARSWAETPPARWRTGRSRRRSCSTSAGSTRSAAGRCSSTWAPSATTTRGCSARSGPTRASTRSRTARWPVRSRASWTPSTRRGSFPGRSSTSSTRATTS